jgi:BirA family biotin operon repressor/biotin-[acetyl-CoA-carboxylase] ligase
MPSPPWEVRRFERLGSTNEYLLAEARAGAPEGLVAVADYQSAGRGRLGRRWEAPPGRSLLASVLLRPVMPVEGLFCCTASVALAAADACVAVAGVAPLIKWPNDLVVGDRKLAGVLAEWEAAAPGGPPRSLAVVVGIGCNLDWPGPDPTAGTSLADHAAPGAGPVRADGLLHALLGFLGPRVTALGSEGGRAGLVDELRQRSATLGRRVRVERVPVSGARTAPDALVGTASDLTPAGHLLLETATGPVEVTAGDVVHLRDQGPDSSGPAPVSEGP